VSALKLSNGNLDSHRGYTPADAATRIILKPGTNVGVPSGWSQRSSDSYSSPDAFDGFRFAKRAAAGALNTRLVDLSPDYLVFGMGVHAR